MSHIGMHWFDITHFTWGIPFETHPKTSCSINTGQWLNSDKNHYLEAPNKANLSGKAVGRRGPGEYWNSWAGHCGKRTWWEESGALLSMKGKLLQNETPEPVSTAWVFCLMCWHHTQTNCNYGLLRNGVLPCAMSLGLALGRVLLSILL